MHRRIYLLRFVLCMALLPYSNYHQAQSAGRHVSAKNGITKPSTLPTHPLGVLFYILPHNFKANAEQRPYLDFHISSGNVWGQPITTFVPLADTDRAALESLEFYSRNGVFDEANSPSEQFAIGYDGVIKDIRIVASIPFGKRTELSLAARSFILTDGTFPFSFFTGDRFIESFHSTIAGGEDPFGRREVGLDQALISYTDRFGNLMNIPEGKFIFSGLEMAFYYYPNLLSEQHIYLNIGTHLGTNLSSYNQSLDLGISLAGIKEFQSRSSVQCLFGLGINALRKRIASFQNNQVDLGTSSFIGSLEGQFEVAKTTRSGSVHSVGLNYRIQTPYNDKIEEDYYVPIPQNPPIRRWHDASRQLYKFQSFWSLIYSFTKKTVFSIYIQQDMLVNNAPDFQTGIRLKIPVSFR